MIFFIFFFNIYVFFVGCISSMSKNEVVIMTKLIIRGLAQKSHIAVAIRALWKLNDT